MTAKTWTPGQIRDLARETVDGRKAIATARGAYFRALIETAQAEIGGKADQAAQRAAVKAVHRRFYSIVNDAIATDAILLADGVARKDLGSARNRRTNFARSSFGTISRWLRVPGHDLMKLDSQKSTKSQIEKAIPPGVIRKHALTKERVQAKAKKLLDGLVGFVRQVAKTDQEQARTILQEASDQLLKQWMDDSAVTTSAKIAAEEQRPLRVGKTIFVPTDASVRKAA
jgi:hypothetical protein